MKPVIKILLFSAALVFASCSSHTHNHAHADVHEHSDACDHQHDHDTHAHADVHEHSDAHDHGSHAGAIHFSHEQAAAASLETESVAAGSFNSLIRTSGKLISKPGKNLRITASSSGIISFKNPSISEGLFFKKGSAIAVISSAGLQDGDPAIKAKLNFEAAELEYKRAEELIKDQIISQKEYEQIKLRYDNANAVWQGQKDKLGDKGLSITAAADGYVGEILVAEGEYVSAGQTIMTFIQNDRIQLVAEVAETYLGSIADICDANFKTVYSPVVNNIKSLNGRLLSYGRSTCGESSFVPVTFEFDNDGSFIPGSFADIWLICSDTDEFISVPVSAIIEEQGLFFVYLKICEEDYKKQEVRLGQSNGERVQVLSGLDEGDEVVVKGTWQVKLASVGTAAAGHTHNH